MRRTAAPGDNPNEWTRSPAARMAPKPLGVSRQACAIRSLTAILGVAPDTHATGSLAAASAAWNGVSLPRRDRPTIRETGMERISPNAYPTRIGMPVITSAYAISTFMLGKDALYSSSVTPWCKFLQRPLKNGAWTVPYNDSLVAFCSRFVKSNAQQDRTSIRLLDVW